MLNRNDFDPDDEMETGSEGEQDVRMHSGDDEKPTSKRQKVGSADEMEDVAQDDAGAAYVVPDHVDPEQAQAKTARREDAAIHCKGQMWRFFRESHGKWSLVKINGKTRWVKAKQTQEPTRAAFEVFFDMLTEARVAERKARKDAFEPIRSGLFCHMCHEQSDNIQMCGGPLVRGKRVSTFKFKGIPAAVPGAGRQCPQVKLDAKVKRARQFADEHHGDNAWLLSACFDVFRQRFADAKSVRKILAERHEDSAVYALLDVEGRIDTFVDVSARLWKPHDGDAAARLTRGTSAYCALEGICANYICFECSRAFGLTTNFSDDPEQSAYCVQCYLRESCRVAVAPLRKRLDKVRAWYFRRYLRPQRDVAFAKPPLASTLVLGRSTRDLWMGSVSAGDHGLIRAPPTRGNQYSYSEINALLSAEPNPFQKHSMDAHSDYVLVRDFTRRHELTEQEFINHCGWKAYLVLRKTMRVLPISGKFVFKDDEYEEAPRGESDDSDEGGRNMLPESDAEDGDEEDSDSEASHSDDSDSDSAGAGDGHSD